MRSPRWPPDWLSEGALPELACEPAALAQLCRDSPDRTVVLVRQALAKAAAAAGLTPSSQVRLIVAIDQMEELFTTVNEPASHELLVRLLAALAGSGLVWVIATIRSDFFHRCGEIPGFSALKDGLGSYELLPPTGPEIAQIIREPARAVGLRYEESVDRGRLDDVLQEAAAADPTVFAASRICARRSVRGGAGPPTADLCCVSGSWRP